MAYEQNLFPYTKNFKPNFIKIILVLIVLSIFGVSLANDAIVVQKMDEKIVQPAINFFLIGSTAILGGGVLEWIIWLSNPISLISIVLFLYNDKYLKRALQLNCIALFLSGSFYFWKEILVSESGATGKIISFESGYFLWVSSVFILLVFQLGYYKSNEIIKK
jgi:hypothetical protein